MNPSAPTDHAYYAQHATALAWLALCPLIAASTSASGAVGLGLAALVVLGIGGLAAATLGALLPRDVRQAATAVLVVGLATAVARCLLVWLPDTHDALGRAVPLIAAGSILILGADTSSWAQPGQGLLVRVVTAGLAGLGAVATIGAMRALAGHGAELAQRPAGGFLLLGLLLAAAGALRHRAAATRARETGGST